MKSLIFKLVLFFCVFLSIIFVFLFADSGYEVEENNETVSDLDSWNLDSSTLNGAQLIENKNIYEDGNGSGLTKVYITVFPTEDKEGNILNFSAFDLHTAGNKEYNPVLDANVQFGNSKGKLTSQSNLDISNATIRVRGNSSRGASFKSYKIKLKDNAEKFYGQDVLNLNKHINDASKVANKFGMDLIQRLENMSGFRTNFMEVYIRDASLPKEEQTYKYYGLYTNIEQPNKSYLKVRGLDENGSLYKAENFEFRITPELKNIDDPDYDEKAFETVLGIREGKEHKKLLQMITDVNDMNQDFTKVFSKYFNEENYLTWMACNILLGNEDIIAHNFILYNPQNSLTWYILPWDFDGTFQFGKYQSYYRAPESLRGIQRMTGVTLHRRYFKVENNVARLSGKMEELMKDYFTKEKVDTLLDSYKPVLETTMTKYPDLLLTRMPPNEMNAYLNQFYDQIKGNYEDYLSSLEYPMPIFVSEPVQNANGSMDFAWEASFDYQGDFITYGIALAKDYDMKDLVFEEKGLTDTGYHYEKDLQPGTYYLAVTATDSKGNTQCSLDYYSEKESHIYRYGVRKITVEE